MAMQHVDGFDSYATYTDLSQTYTAYSCGLSTTLGRYGGGCIIFNDYTSFITWSLPDATGAPVWIGFAIYIVNGSNPTTGILAQFISAFGTDMSIRYNPAYGIWVLVNGLGAELLVLSYAVTSGIWHWIDINYQFGSSGQVSVWVDNVNI